MSAEWWAAVAAVAGVLILLLGGVWRVGLSLGEIRIGVKELLTRDQRMDTRVGAVEKRVDDHSSRIARLEGGRDADGCGRQFGG